MFVVDAFLDVNQEIVSFFSCPTETLYKFNNGGEVASRSHGFMKTMGGFVATSNEQAWKQSNHVRYQ
jgi:hypothetical protein